MKRLVSKHERERSRKRNQLIIGLILVFVMVSSTLGFAIQGGHGGGGTVPNGGTGGGSNTVNYNGFEFVNQNGLWVLGNFVFRNTPRDVEDIGFGLNDINIYQGLPLYISSENADAEAEISVNLGQVAERVQTACLEGEECSGDFPVRSCTDNFIIIRESINNGITQDGGCVFIEGSQGELVELADQFLFKILGIR